MLGCIVSGQVMVRVQVNDSGIVNVMAYGCVSVNVWIVCVIIIKVRGQVSVRVGVRDRVRVMINVMISIKVSVSVSVSDMIRVRAIFLVYA